MFQVAGGESSEISVPLGRSARPSSTFEPWTRPRHLRTRCTHHPSYPSKLVTKIIGKPRCSNLKVHRLFGQTMTHHPDMYNNYLMCKIVIYMHPWDHVIPRTNWRDQKRTETSTRLRHHCLVALSLPVVSMYTS